MSKKIITEMNIKQIPSGTIFKIGFICNISIWGVVALIFGVMGMSGMDIVKWNDANVYGIQALVVAFLICFVFAICGSVVLMLGGLIGSRLMGSSSLGKLSYFVETEN